MSEFRQDPVSGEWIIMAPERAKRPHDMFSLIPKREASPRKNCPFENLEKTGNWPPILSIPDSENWEVVVLPNKFPAIVHQPGSTTVFKNGPYMSSMGVGYHDVVVTRDHEKNLTDLPPKKVFDIFDILRKRFLMLAEDDCIHYVSALHNWGPSAGASIYHPHYQIFALPIIPPDVHHSLEGSKKYFKKHRRCVHCEILAYEKGEKKRIIAENEHAVALAPYTSRRPFEVRIFPKKHFPFFEKTTDAELRGCALMLQSVLARIRKYLRDPDLNFYIHTGPLKSQKSYSHYHWHIEIIPNIPPPPAGFEMGTGIDINTVTPEKTAAILKGKA